MHTKLSWADDKFSQRLFLTKLQECECKRHTFTDREREFLQDMRRKFDSREDMRDLGVKPWEPTAKQLNYLSALAAS